MIDQAIVTTLNITRLGERKNFQVTLPLNTRAIVGFEYGFIRKDYTVAQNPVVPVPATGPLITFPPFLVGCNKVIGRVSLQVPGIEGGCFQEELIEYRNMQLGEGIAAILLPPSLWMQARKKTQFEFNVDSAVPFIEGTYIDSWGAGEFDSLAYTVHLYLWIEQQAP